MSTDFSGWLRSTTDVIRIHTYLWVLSIVQRKTAPLSYCLISSLRKQPTFGDLPLVSPPNDVRETSAEIPYWWRVTSQIWVVFLVGRAAWEIWFNQSEALPRPRWWRVISMEFLLSFHRRHLAGKPVVASPNLGCFLKLFNFYITGSFKRVAKTDFSTKRFTNDIC